MLQLKDIKKDYIVADQKVPALNGITLDFRDNEFVSVLGPSGCGKTTLMNIVGGLDKATGGELVINGKSTFSFKDKDWDNYRNKKIGFIFQNYYLIPHLTIQANVELALTIAGISKTERSRRAKEVLLKVGLEDHLHKKPNQLSGGQAQRVAIARALINEPEIILADEPTGALDTKTSVQILDLIKEISKEKLVIMVTHNSALADQYSTRIIKMLDGKITDDSNPFSIKSVSTKTAIKKPGKQTAKNSKASAAKSASKFSFKTLFKRKKDVTSMSFFTALHLSLKNLFTKKGRTILTSIAGSIGIIGIALILALSNGINIYIAKVQTDTLSSNPITISSNSIDITEMMNSMRQNESLPKFPTKQTIIVEEIRSLNNLRKKNVITEDYINYLNENLNSDWYYDLVYKTGLELNVYGINAGSLTYSKMQNTNTTASFMGTQGIWQQLVVEDFFNTQFDVMGNMATNKNQAVLVVDQYNKLNKATLIMLGLMNMFDTSAEIDFSDVIGKTYKIATNDQLYVRNGNVFVNNSALVSQLNFNDMIELEIVGIARMNESTDMGVVSSGIAYTKELTDWLQEQNSQSEIVEYMANNPTTNPFTGQEYEDMFDSGGELEYSKEELRERDYRAFGGVTLPNEIRIYPRDFASKDQIKRVLQNYNVGKESEQVITFTDMSDIVGNMITNMVNVITYVLVGFTAVSLVVSCVMIAIITYVSVIERTKEIGILRSIGARKKDVSRVFNAESAILGFSSGVLGVVVAYILCIPIGFIIQNYTGIAGIANLNLLNAFLLVAISIVLMFISGFIPSRIAAKRDPVRALRTE